MKMISEEEIITRVNQAITLLDTDPVGAKKLLSPFIPVNGSVDLNYGIYTLQYVALFGEEYFSRESNSNSSMPKVINYLFELCKKSNHKEYVKLIRWGSDKTVAVTEQMKRAKLNIVTGMALSETLSLLSQTNSRQVKEIMLTLQANSPKQHLLGNTYKDTFEIDYFLILLGNLIRVSKGEKFSQDIYKSIKVDGKTLANSNGHLTKGLVLRWIENEADRFLKEIIKSSYDTGLRNLIGGHNDYIFDPVAEEYVSKDKKNRYKLVDVLSYLSRLELLQNALRLESSTRSFEDLPMPGRLSEIGYMDWKTDGKKLLVLQNWSNYMQRGKADFPKILSFYRVPIRSTRKTISIGFNNRYIYPCDLRVLPSNQSLKFLKSLVNKKTINLTICSVAPPIKPFTKMTKSTIETGGGNLLVLNDLNSEVEIEQKSLRTLIDYLEKE